MVLSRVSTHGGGAWRHSYCCSVMSSALAADWNSSEKNGVVVMDVGRMGGFCRIFPWFCVCLGDEKINCDEGDEKREARGFFFGHPFICGFVWFIQQWDSKFFWGKFVENQA